MKTRLSKVSVSINMESYKNALTCELTVSKRDENRCVALCNRNAKIHHYLSFHHISKKLKMRKNWLVAIRRDEGLQFRVAGRFMMDTYLICL